MDSYTIDKLRKIEKELRKASNMHAAQADRIDACIRRSRSENNSDSYSSRKSKVKGEKK